MIEFSVRRSDLVDAGACEEGLAVVDEWMRDQGCGRWAEYRGHWTNEEQIKLLTSPVASLIDWAVANGFLPAINLRGLRALDVDATLAAASRMCARDCNLRGLNMAHSTIPGALFINCDLVGARFFCAIADRAELAWCELDGANFRGANLRHASFDHSSLRGANLTGADLGGAVFTDACLAGAKIDGADFTGATMPDGLTYPCQSEPLAHYVGGE